MNKLIEFGRKAMFYVRVLSGYEERRIRSYRLELQQRLQNAQERKEAMVKVPEKIILSELRKMVDNMEAMNKRLEETEAVFEEYFKPIDKEAEIIMKMQLDGEEHRMKEMIKTMRAQALLEREEAEKLINVQNTDIKHPVQEKPPSESPYGKG